MPTKKSNKEKKLNIKQEAFCLEYLIDMNASRAYRDVYKCKPKTAEVSAHHLLRNPKIQEYLKTTMKNKIEKLDKGSDWVLQNLFELVERCMQKKKVMIRQGKNIVQKTEEIEHEDGTVTEEGVWQFDSAGANSALEKLGKYYKMFTEKIENTGNMAINWNEQKTYQKPKK